MAQKKSFKTFPSGEMMYKDLQMKGEKDWLGQMLSNQRSGSVVGELVRSVIIAGRGGGKG